MSQVNDFIKRLDTCPPGKPGWSDFENICIDLLQYLFSPTLHFHGKQARTYSGINRMDAIFSNRNITATNDPKAKAWYHLYVELQARLILFEFKNYDTSEITQAEIDQTRNYLTEPMGRLAILISNKKPNDHAHRHRNTVYSRDKKVILLLTADDLKEMLAIKERGEEPSDFILDLLDSFYIQHE